MTDDDGKTRDQEAEDSMTMLTVVIIWILLVVGLLSYWLWPAAAQAEDGLYIHGHIGQTRGALSQPDGVWRQEGLWYDTETTALAYGGGLGYEWQNWAVEAGILSLGTMKSGGGAVADQHYDVDTKTAHHGAHIKNFQAQDRVVVGTLTVKRYVDVLGVRPYALAGVFVGRHDLQWVTHFPDRTTLTNRDEFEDLLYGPVVGGGVCYGWLCGQVQYLLAVNTPLGWPISTEFIVPTVQLNVPFSWLESISGTTRDYLWQR